MDLLLNDEQLKFVVNNVAVTEDGLKLLGHLIESSSCFSCGFVENNNRTQYNKGRADLGLEIAEYLQEYAFDKYVEILKRRRTSDDDRSIKRTR